MASSPSVATAMTLAPRARTSCTLETTFSYVCPCSATTTTGTSGVISAMGPCFISPAA
jgi:hypothetical protein